MKKYFTLFLLFIFLVINSSCKKYEVSNLPETQIHFGEGGGITGRVTQYCLLENGQLFNKKHFTNDFKSYKKIKKKVAKKQFKSCEKINFEEIDLNNPGDKYYYIGYETKGIKHKVTWGRNKEEVPEELVSLYKSLKGLTFNKNGPPHKRRKKHKEKVKK